MKHTLTFLLGSALVVSSACGGKSSGETAPPPSPPPSEPVASAPQNDDAIAESGIAITVEIGAAAVAQMPDCAKMAAAADAVITKHSADIERVKAWTLEVQNDEARNQAVMEKYGHRLVGSMKDMDAASEQCANDPAWSAVAAKMQ